LLDGFKSVGRDFVKEFGTIFLSESVSNSGFGFWAKSDSVKSDAVGGEESVGEGSFASFPVLMSIGVTTHEDGFFGQDFGYFFGGKLFALVSDFLVL
jgi:hypothetical protein